MRCIMIGLALASDRIVDLSRLLVLPTVVEMLTERAVWRHGGWHGCIKCIGEKSADAFSKKKILNRLISVCVVELGSSAFFVLATRKKEFNKHFFYKSLLHIDVSHLIFTDISLLRRGLSAIAQLFRREVLVNRILNKTSSECRVILLVVSRGIVHVSLLLYCFGIEPDKNTRERPEQSKATQSFIESPGDCTIFSQQNRKWRRDDDPWWSFSWNKRRLNEFQSERARKECKKSRWNS